MHKFRIIPVIDILNSKAVHAIRGEREKYKPLQSRLINSSEPKEIIKSLKQKFNFREFYIADLDSIINHKPNFELLSNILKIPDIEIMIDPGIRDKNDILNYSNFKIGKLILGLETIKNLDVINKGLEIMSKNKLIVSVDMYKGNLLSRIKEVKNQPLTDLINILQELSLQEIILLDLFRVGQKSGGIPPLFLKIRKNFKGRILVGGGIKNSKDLMEYYSHKFSGVLIATALYDGSISKEKLKTFQKREDSNQYKSSL